MKYIAIVDPYSTGNKLALEFKKKGFTTVCIKSSEAIPEVLSRSFLEFSFDIALPYLELDALISRLRSFPEISVIAGAESGVIFADRIIDNLGLHWNDQNKSACRRDKFLMIEAVRKAGLLAPNQILSANEDEIISWAQAQTDFPLVLKPCMSTGSDNIHFCETAKDIQTAVQKIIGKTNILDIRNDAVLAQSFLEGPVYVVNSVSRDGKHLTTDVWEFNFERSRQGHVNFYEHHMLGADFPKLRELVTYNNAVLDAVGIANGPSHTEIKLTNRGPVLIETSARLMGATIESGPFIAARGFTQVEMTVLAISDPEKFDALLAKEFSILQNLSIVWVHFNKPGVVVKDNSHKVLSSFSTFNCYVGRPKVGDKVTFSSDTSGRGGFIYLVGPDKNKIEEERSILLQLIKDQLLFEICHMQ